MHAQKRLEIAVRHVLHDHVRRLALGHDAQQAQNVVATHLPVTRTRHAARTLSLGICGVKMASRMMMSKAAP